MRIAHGTTVYALRTRALRRKLRCRSATVDASVGRLPRRREQTELCGEPLGE
jgi:hypothetical protein